MIHGAITVSTFEVALILQKNKNFVVALLGVSGVRFLRLHLLPYFLLFTFIVVRNILDLPPSPRSVPWGIEQETPISLTS